MERTPASVKEPMWLRIIFIFSTLTAGFYLWRVLIDMIEPIIAWRGYSPISYVYGKIAVADFSRGFPSGQLYDKSLFMHIYPFAFSTFGISPETMIPVVIGFQIVILSIAFIFLTRTIYPQSPMVIPCTVVLLVIASYARCMDFARYDLFSEALVLMLYYFFADAVRIVSIAFFIRGQILVSAVLMALCYMVYPSYAIIGAGFLASAYLAKPAAVPQARIAISLAIFCVLSLAWTVGMFDLNSVQGAAIDRTTWINLTRLSSYHTYPIDMGIFTFRPAERLLPFLAFLMLFVVYFFQGPLRIMDRQLLAGITAALLLTVLGVVFSGIHISSALIKLSLHRANDLAINICLIYIVNGLWNEIVFSGAWRKALAIIVLIGPFYYEPGFILGYASLLALPMMLKSDSRRRATLLVYYLGILVLASVYFANGTLSLNDNWMAATFTGGKRLALIFFSTFVLAHLIRLAEKREAMRMILVTVMAVLIVSGSAIYWIGQQSSLISDRELKESYKDAQVWARHATAADALFMIDPTIYYGWRDYSLRSSFGNLREWVYTSWQYASDYRLFREGQNRFNEFSLDINNYFGPEGPSYDSFDRMDRDVQTYYNSASDSWRKKLVNKYAIDYFVFVKDRMETQPALPIAYENKRIVVYKADRQ
ncbi:MAG: hypothetical protein RIN56_05550 [Sporomusaceae bacterium]|nr:hypothetical protein [Sporomusaceae bacterium]